MCPVCESLSSTCLSSLTVVGCNKVPCPWQSEPAGFLHSQLHDQVYVVKSSDRLVLLRNLQVKLRYFVSHTVAYIFCTIPLFIFPHRDQTVLLKSIFVVFTSFTIGIKKRNFIWSWKRFFTPLLQTTERQTEMWNHSAFVYDWKENDPIENGRRRPFACGIQEIYKSQVDLCVKDREVFWSLTSCP